MIVLDTHNHPTKCICWFWVLDNVLAGAGSGCKYENRENEGYVHSQELPAGGANCMVLHG